MALRRTIFIAGAGIGGLTAALCLAQRGFRVVVLEKAERLEEAGAGLQLSPNASRILVNLGLGPRLARVAVVPDAIALSSARAGGELVRLPIGKDARADAPYWVVHRADLQAALADAVAAHPDIDLKLGSQFEDLAPHPRGVTIVHRQGDLREQGVGLALVGADGIWSAVRNNLFPDIQPQFSGLIAWRGTLEARSLPRDHTAPRVQLWMGPNAHLVAYPVSSGRQVNLVAVLPGGWNRPGWSAPGEATELKNAFSSPTWPSTVRMLIGAVDGWRKWALFQVPEGCQWHADSTALLGDAVHGMLPFAAQGAGMAIEDAAVLAAVLGETPLEPGAKVEAALRRYGKLRRERVRRVQRFARQQGRIYHMSGTMALARDLTIRALGAKRLLARQSWIYDWQP